MLRLAAVLPLALVAFGCTAASDSVDSGSIGKQPDALVDRIDTEDGWMDVEVDYLPRVCTSEAIGTSTEALAAQAIASRTFLYYDLTQHPGLGTPDEPISNSSSSQTYAMQPSPACIAAVAATRGVLGRYETTLITSNFVPGALWSNGAPSSQDPSQTEEWVTYNQGLEGSSVVPTPLGADSKANRGCMSQNGASSLATSGSDHESILRFFFGDDLTLNDPVSADACDGLDFGGKCDGDVLHWCEEGSVLSSNCASANKRCAYLNESRGYDCVDATSAGGVAPCGDVTDRGLCQGSVLKWCNQGTLQVSDCTAEGLRCDYSDSASRFSCR